MPNLWRDPLELGRVVMTTHASLELNRDEIRGSLERHRLHDWGELDDHDRLANARGVKTGDRILSCYTSSEGQKFWIITEGDRSYTTVLLPEDY